MGQLKGQRTQVGVGTGQCLTLMAPILSVTYEERRQPPAVGMAVGKVGMAAAPDQPEISVV